LGWRKWLRLYLVAFFGVDSRDYCFHSFPHSLTLGTRPQALLLLNRYLLPAYLSSVAD
jgi:hypothetical protein